jgi:hypothetical protein
MKILLILSLLAIVRSSHFKEDNDPDYLSPLYNYKEIGDIIIEVGESQTLILNDYFKGNLISGSVNITWPDDIKDEDNGQRIYLE